MNEFWAAIAGAVVGGIIAFGIQIIALRASAKERAANAAEQKKALGHSLLFKAIQIYSHLRVFNKHLKDGAAEAKKFGDSEINWKVVLPLANLPAKVHFSTDEMALLLGLKNFEVFNKVVSFDELHNSTIEIFATYTERRSSMTATLSAELDGAVGSTDLDAKQLAMLAPRMYELDALLKQMLVRCEQDEKEASEILLLLQKVLGDELGMTYLIQKKSDAEVRDLA